MLVTLPLYILRQLGKGLFIAFLIYTFVIMPLILGQMVRHGVSMGAVLAVVPLLIPYISQWVMAPAIVTGSVLCYGRFSATNEYAATQASGIWPGWIMMPAFLIGIVSTLATIYLNEGPLTSATESITKIIIHDQVNMIQEQLSRQGVVQVGDYHLYRHPADANGNMALDATVFTSPKDGGGARVDRIILARDHDITVESTPGKDGGEGTHAIVFTLTDCHIEEYRDGAFRIYGGKKGEKRQVIEVDRFEAISIDAIRCWGIGKLLARIREVQGELGAAGGLSEHERKSLLKSMQRCGRELHSRLALSFSCFLFALVGPLLGLLGQHGDRTSRFGFGFGIWVGFFLLFLLMRNLADFGLWLLWIPNAMLFVGVFFLWRRVFWKV